MTPEQNDIQQLPDDRQNNTPLAWWWWLGCVLFVAAAGLHSATKVVGGGDTWVAMQNGRYTIGGDWAKDDPGRTLQMKFLDVFGIHMTQKDPFSAESRPFDPDSAKLSSSFKRVGMIVSEILRSKEKERPEYSSEVEHFGWINQNWLTHVMFYKMKNWFGEDDKAVSKGEFFIVLYKLLQAMLTALFAYWAGRKMGAHPLLAALFAGFGILLSRSYIDLRPNISTIFFASIMIFLLACWKRGHYKTLLWIIPVMILESNVHGGFIYFIMIFWIVLICYLLQKYLGKWNYFLVILGMAIGLVLVLQGLPTLREMGQQWQRMIEVTGNEEQYGHYKKLVFHVKLLAWMALAGFAGCLVLLFVRYRAAFAEVYTRIDKRAFWFLGGLTGAVTIIPAIFSPFGLENLVHPFIVATGVEGKIWRDVVEWRPIWDGTGFGTVKYYLVFLWLFAVVFAGWWVLFLLKPTRPELYGPKRKKKQAADEQDDPSWPKIDLAWLGIMAITLLMSIKSRRFVFLGGVVLAPFMAAMAQDGIYMARKLFKAQNISRGWEKIGAAGSLAAAGGMAVIFVLAMWDIYYRPHWDGQDRTVFRRMVGINDQPARAMPFFDENDLQGVVFNEWTNGGFLAFGQTPDEQTGEPDCKVFMDGRSQAAYSVKHFMYWKTLNGMVERGNEESEKRWFERIDSEARRMGVEPESPAFFDGVFNFVYTNRLNPGKGVSEQKLNEYESMLRYALIKNNGKLFDNILERDDITVALLTRARSQKTLFPHFEQSDQWQPVYIDDKHVIFLRKDAEANRHILAREPTDWVYPDDFSRNYSLGYLLCHTRQPQKIKAGLSYLMKIEDYDPLAYYQTFTYGRVIGLRQELFDYFSGLQELYQKKLEQHPDRGRVYYRQALSAICHYLAVLSKEMKQPEEAKAYQAKSDQYKEEFRAMVERYRENWLW